MISITIIGKRYTRIVCLENHKIVSCFPLTGTREMRYIAFHSSKKKKKDNSLSFFESYVCRSGEVTKRGPRGQRKDRKMFLFFLKKLFLPSVCYYLEGKRAMPELWVSRKNKHTTTLPVVCAHTHTRISRDREKMCPVIHFLFSFLLVNSVWPLKGIPFSSSGCCHSLHLLFRPFSRFVCITREREGNHFSTPNGIVAKTWSTSARLSFGQTTRARSFPKKWPQNETFNNKRYTRIQGDN